MTYDILTLSVDRLLNKEYFLWKNHAENVHKKLVSDPFLILVSKQKHPFHAINSFKNQDILKNDYQKTFKKLILVFLSNPVLFNEQCFEKQNRSGTSDQ